MISKIAYNTGQELAASRLGIKLALNLQRAAVPVAVGTGIGAAAGGLASPSDQRGAGALTGATIGGLGTAAGGILGRALNSQNSLAAGSAVDDVINMGRRTDKISPEELQVLSNLKGTLKKLIGAKADDYQDAGHLIGGVTGMNAALTNAGELHED